MQVSEQPFTPPNLEPAFFGASPNTVKFAASLDDLHAGRVQEIPTEEFAQQHNFTWIKSMLVSPTDRDQIYQDKTHPRKNITSVEERLCNPLVDFVVCHVDSRVGNGLFWDPRAKTSIPAGTVLGIYAGSISSPNHEIAELSRFPSTVKQLQDLAAQMKAITQSTSDRSSKLDQIKPMFAQVSSCLSGFDAFNRTYKMKLSHAEQRDSVLSDLYCMLDADARKYGNVFRFCLDLPSPLSTGEAKLAEPHDQKFKAEIFTANIGVYPAVYQGCPIAYVYAMRRIEPGDPVGFDYQNDSNLETRFVFNRRGAIIGEFETTKKQIKLLPDLQRTTTETEVLGSGFLDILAIQQLTESNPPTDSFDFKKTFVLNVNFAIDVFMARFAPGTEQRQLLEETKARFNARENDTADKRYRALFDVWNKKTPPEGLAAFKAELIGYMQTYKEQRAKIAAGNQAGAPAHAASTRAQVGADKGIPARIVSLEDAIKLVQRLSLLSARRQASGGAAADASADQSAGSQVTPKQNTTAP